MKILFVAHVISAFWYDITWNEHGKYDVNLVKYCGLCIERGKEKWHSQDVI